MTARSLSPAELGYASRSEVPFDELDQVGPAPESAYSYLDSLPAGPVLGAELHRIDRSQLTGYDLVLVMKARQRQASHLQAELLRDIVELGFTPPSNPGDSPVRSGEFSEYTPEEVRCALVWTRRASESTVDYAFDMMVRFPMVGQALSDGMIDLPRAKTIVSGVGGLDRVAAEAVIDRILALAPELTTGQIRARMRRLCIDADPEAARKRYESGLENRRVTAHGRAEGTADVWGENLEADRVASVMTRINEAARRLRSDGDTRTLDQIKADIFLRLLEGQNPDGVPAGRRSPVVDIRVDLDTLLGLNERAAEIPGWGPVIADIARQAIEERPDGTWRVVVTDPDSGTVLWDGTTRRRPTADQKRHVVARRQECSHPRCRMPASQCDLDHIDPYARGGPSLTVNLQPLCRHDHMLKTLGVWQTQQQPGGETVWISPYGHRYRQPP